MEPQTVGMRVRSRAEQTDAVKAAQKEPLTVARLDCPPAVRWVWPMVDLWVGMWVLSQADSRDYQWAERTVAQ